MKWLQTTARQLIVFFVIAFVLTWAAWIPVFRYPDQVPSQISFIGLFAPALSALLVAGLANGKSGILNIFRKYFTWHLDVKWSLLAFLLIPVIFLFAALLITKVNFQRLWIGNSWLFIAGSFLFLIVINSGEEVGWRGFALPRLQEVLGNPLLASLILGIIWGVWHLPEYLNPAQSSFPFPVFLLFTTGISILYTVLYNRSSGSILVAVILHASTDIMPRIMNIGVFTTSTWLWITALTWVVALLLYGLTRKLAMVTDPGAESVNLIKQEVDTGK